MSASFQIISKDSKRYKYKTVTLPELLLDEIKSFIEENLGLGYGSVTEFIKDASRNHMKEQEKIKKKKKK